MRPVLYLLLLASAARLGAQGPQAAPEAGQDADPKTLIPPVYESIVIRATPLDPAIDRRNQTVFQQSLFSRDDQLFHLLDAGINAGQHEGGGKSLEIRRFGFNLDHGGVNGGLKVLVDDVQQNYGTQGHGQGYLGSLKSVTPELVEGVDIVNGPFNAEYGDFSGLGVVHVRTKETLPDWITGRFASGSFDTYRGVLSFSPEIRQTRSLFTYEGTATNGPFLKPMDYRRDNLSGSVTHNLSGTRAIGAKFNLSTYRFNSSGQIPLDEVTVGRLDRFGYLDPGDGGLNHSGRGSVYYRQEQANGAVTKVDGFVERSLWDLFSNFTFYLNNPVVGDGIQQHDSRLRQAVNAQYARPQIFSGGTGLLAVGGNYLDSQMNVGLYQRVMRTPYAVASQADARVSNGAGYLQETATLWRNRLTLGAGIRYDVFRYRVDDRIAPESSGTQTQGRWQPKATAALTPFASLPLTLHLNYGRGVSSLDARGVVQRRDQPAVATTDFVQAGVSWRLRRLSLVGDYFRIHNSNQLVYVPDDGTLEFLGPTFSHGYETKASWQVTRSLSVNGGLTRVLASYYRDALPRVYVDRAPSLVANAGLTLANWRNWNASVRMRAINSYRLDGEDATLRAAGHTVFDFALSRRLRRNLDLNFAIDNVFDRSYYETQNYFESRLQGEQPLYRIHATPGYSRTITAGLTFRFGGK